MLFLVFPSKTRYQAASAGRIRRGLVKQEFAEQAIVLKVGVFREADCWVRLVSEQKGLLTAFAFGGFRSRRRFCGCLDPFSLVHFRFSSNATGKYLYLNEGTLLERFTGLRNNMALLGMAVNCLKFVEAAHPGAQGSGTAYPLLLETLRLLDSGAEVPAVLPLLFRARLTFEQGYRPELTRCNSCGCAFRGSDRVCFALEQGRVFCPGCMHRDSDSRGDRVVLLFGAALAAVQDILGQPLDEWGRAVQGKGIPRECLRALDSYVQYHMGLQWQGAGFQKT